MSFPEHLLSCECVGCTSPVSSYVGKRGTARALLDRLQSNGVVFELVGERIRFNPKRLVVEEDLDELRRLKPYVVALLSGEESSGEGTLQEESLVRDELEVFEIARQHFGDYERKETA